MLCYYVYWYDLVNKFYGIFFLLVLLINSSIDCELLEMVLWMMVDLISFVYIYSTIIKMIKLIVVWL